MQDGPSGPSPLPDGPEGPSYRLILERATDHCQLSTAYINFTMPLSQPTIAKREIRPSRDANSKSIFQVWIFFPDLGPPGVQPACKNVPCRHLALRSAR